MLFNLYIILVYVNALCILCVIINKLLNIFNKIERWSELNIIIEKKQKWNNDYKR